MRPTEPSGNPPRPPGLPEGQERPRLVSNAKLRSLSEGPADGRASRDFGEEDTEGAAGRPGAHNILVAVRCRALLPQERVTGGHAIISIANRTTVILEDPHTTAADDYLRLNKSKERRYHFDQACDETAQNLEVYERTTRFLIPSVIQGFNATVFAYGATSAGKTHTMLGYPGEPGIMLLTLRDLFSEVANQKDNNHFEIKCSFLEVYNENVRDLLRPDGDFLDIREDPVKGMCVAGISEVGGLESAEEIMALLHQGNKNRTTESTGANVTSSRSHAVLQVMVHQRDRTADIVAHVNLGKLSMIDLAGSERASQTNNKGRNNCCPSACRHVESIPLPSPNWHRQERAKRSRARARVRQAKAHFRQPRPKDLLLLYLHHSGGSGRGMGKTWKQRQGYGKDDSHGRDSWAGDGYGQQPYISKESLWKGAYSPRAPWRRNDPSRTPSFPSYTQLTPKEAPSSSAADTSFTPDSTVSEMQRSLTAAKKAEQKVRTLMALREKQAGQWDAYKEKLERTFVQEHKKYLAEKEKLQRDLDSAIQQQETARKAVRCVYSGEPVRPSQTVLQERASASEWEEMRSTWEKAQETDMDGVLQRAMQDIQAEPLHPGRRDVDMDGVPSRKLRPEFLQSLLMDPGIQAAFWAQASFQGMPPGVPGMPDTMVTERAIPTFGVHASEGECPLPTANSGDKATVEQDTSRILISQAEARSPTRVEVAPGSHPGQRDPSQLRVPASEAPPRQDVKSATKTTPQRNMQHKGLSDKLEEKRQKERLGNAMHPFGIPSLTTAKPEGAPTGSFDLSQEEDAEELNKADHSPGLGNLE
ncbi:kif19 [Symbiodinium sp. CCMP2592]|nr:kif19 [Symbiodinium sp. CCMP2592]